MSYGVDEEPHNVVKLMIVECKDISSSTGKRVWIQGHVREVQSNNAIIDDGSACLNIVLGTNMCNISEYVMVIGQVSPSDAETLLYSMVAHQITPLSDPNREPLWWMEVIEARHSKCTP
mmetsp:Transcript_10754/g.13043  ORF Transcript_10754/g.13043 Transcript_10754/m.13043 type:complete len:119 (+) Transcript_10754:61-417(+)